MNIIFIIGCGRSGTTILGKSVSHLENVLYLNEPRYLWNRYFKKLNIWSSNGNIIADKKNHKYINGLFLKAHIYLLSIFHKKNIIVEKTPINSFRLNFLKSLFPKAKFIILRRNGIEVAKSISKKVDSTNWFGNNSVKWVRLLEIANKLNIDLPNDISNFEKGLLEYRLSNLYIDNFLRDNHQDLKVLELTYSSFVSNPIRNLNIIADFIGSNKVKKLDLQIKRKSKKISKDNLSAFDLKLGGDSILQSINY